MLIRRADARDRARNSLDAIPDRIDTLVSSARQCLQNATPQLMANLFDLLQIDLHRSPDGESFEGTGSIPIPDDEEAAPLELGGEVREGTPQRLYSNLTVVTFRIEATARQPPASAGPGSRLDPLAVSLSESRRVALMQKLVVLALTLATIALACSAGVDEETHEAAIDEAAQVGRRLGKRHSGNTHVQLHQPWTGEDRRSE